MKPTPISVAMLVVSLFLAPALLAQSPDSANQSAASSAASAAEVPRLIKFSGTLLDSQDRPLAGPVGVTFALNAQQTGGAALWMETQNVTPDAHGNYTVLLGANSTNGVPAELFASGEARWLEVQVERQAEQPRILLVSVPYALKAKDAETLGGKPASAYALAGAGVSYVTGTTGTSESSAAATGGTALAASTSGPQPLALTPCASVTSDGTATVNSISKFTTACNVESSAILENGGKVGMGIAPSTSTKLFLVDSQKDFGTAWLQRGVFSSSVTTPGTNHGVAFDLDTTNMLISSGVTDLGYRIGVRALAFASNNPGFAGTLNQQFGLVAQAGIFTAASTAKVTNAYGGQFAIFNQVPGTTITNAYGVYISNSGTGGTITNRYDLYASSPNANNFFAGKVGIGTTTPVANLEVNGTTKFDGLVSFAGGQAFPGTGTVTAVNTVAGSGLMGGGTSGALNLGLLNTCTANQVLQWSGTAWVCATVGGAGTVTSVGSGLGLTGGPITSSGTLAINTAVVPQLGVVNTFNNNQNIVGNLTLSGTANVMALGGTFDGPSGGVFGRDTINDGANRIGVQGASASTGGAGVVGTSTATTGQAAGVRGFAASTGGAGVFGQAASATGVTAGVRGVASSPSGRGVGGDMVAAIPNTAIASGAGVVGTYGFNLDGSVNASATGGAGVFGQNTATNGAGVYGTATATSGATAGVQGTSASPGGVGGYFTNSAGGFMFAAVDSANKPILAADPNGAYVNTAVFSSNNDATGTVLNELVKYTSADTVSVTSAGDPGGAVGIVASGAGTAGKAVVAFFGEAHCVFDNTAAVADYFQISPTAAGQCHDAGSAYPANGRQVLGRVTKITSVPPKVFVFGGAETRPGGGGGGITAVNTAAGSGLMGGGSSGALNLSLLGTCGTGQVLQWTGTAWVCASVSSGAGVTSVSAGTGIIATPNPIISSGTVAINTTVVPQLGVANTFTANQTINSGGTALTATSSVTSGAVVSGTASSTADNANDNGVQGVTSSPIGIGVNGLASDTTGGTTKALGSVGVNGQSNSPNGIGVIGLATDTTAVVVGTSPNQGTIGVQGQSNSPNGIGVNAFDNYQCLLTAACDPSAVGAPAPAGLVAQVLHANGRAVIGIAGSPTVRCAMPACDPTKTGNVGVVGKSFHPNGVGIVGAAKDSSVTNTAGGTFSVGVLGQAQSPTSYALYAHFVPATVDVGAAALFNNNAGFTAQPPTTLCTGVAKCTILELQANGIREFHFDGAGNAHAAGTFTGGGADFAESVSVRGERRLYEAGDVMVIDDAGNRSLVKSQEPYSTLVAGIVSTKPGMLASLHNSTTSAGQKAIEAEVPLAVIGIVPCKVTAENGPIHAGDLLVTSSIAGYAMKGTDRARMLGAVVGKAMQPMQSGKGVLEVLVTLQ
jgi:hypothetical protein